MTDSTEKIRKVVRLQIIKQFSYFLNNYAQKDIITYQIYINILIFPNNFYMII